jgi:ATP-dependent DNA helicase RecG
MKRQFLNSKAINKLQLKLAELAVNRIPETLPESLIDKLKIVSLENALRIIHKPINTRELKNATFRLKFEELFLIQLKILALKNCV